MPSTGTSKNSSSSLQTKPRCPRCDRDDRVFRYARLRAFVREDPDRDRRDDDDARLYNKLQAAAAAAGTARQFRRKPIEERYQKAMKSANEADAIRRGEHGNRQATTRFGADDIRRWRDNAKWTYDNELLADDAAHTHDDRDYNTFNDIHRGSLGEDYDDYLKLEGCRDLDYFNGGLGFHIGDSTHFCFFRPNSESPIHLCVYDH